MNDPAQPSLCEIAVEPRTVDDQQRLTDALTRLCAEDVSLRFSTEPESGLTLLQGLDEDHLDNAVDILRRTYKVYAKISAPQVVYRETLGRKAEVDYTHKKQSCGTGQFARVLLTFEPLLPGSGFVFEDAIVRQPEREPPFLGAVPAEFVHGVETGLKSVMNSGPLAGFPVIDFKVTLTNGAYHDIDSDALAFEIAARAAFRAAAKKVEMKLLEPIMKVEVVSPEDYVGAIIGDLRSRQGMILGQEMRGDATVINAMVSLANMFGYSKRLRTIAASRASYTMRFDYYRPVPTRNPDDDLFPPALGMRA